MSKSLLDRQQGRLFEPKFSRQSKPASNLLVSQHKNDNDVEYFKNTNIESTSSFRYNDKPYISSVQQLRIDYSRFENHTFFHSAVANVNEAFDKIVNFYPYEKSKKELEKFEDDLTGFEKYVLDSFPKNIGYLNFSGSAIGESLSNGTQISVKDRSGAGIKQISDTIEGLPVLDPNYSPFCLEMFLKIPEQTNDNQIIVQKFKSLANNFTLALSESSSTSSCDVNFFITSGSNFAVVSGSLEKGIFNHVHAMYDPFNDRRVKLLINNNIHSSSQQALFEKLNYDAADLTIGSGSTCRIGSDIFTNKQTFSGSIDDLRYFHKTFDVETIKKRKLKSFYPHEDDNLKLYYRFNEPYGTYSANNVVLDASGNSLHSFINNFEVSNRLTGSDVPVLSENIKNNPVLFPEYTSTLTLNESLITTASYYDNFNPNLITKLIPKHYFQEATNFRDFGNELESLESNFSTFSNSFPGKSESEIPPMQILIKLLLSYAKFFDELKLLIDAVSSYRFTEYEEYDTTPDPLLKRKAKLLNLKLPNLFSYAKIDQLLDGIDLNKTPGVSAKSLNQIQNLIWRRIISEGPKINKSRGTIRSIKSIFRNSGIEPDNLLNIREYGGSKEKSLDASKEIKKDVYRFLSFTGSLNNSTSNLNYQGYPIDSEIPKLKSGYLSGSRVQIGNPKIRGSFINKTRNNPHGISNNSSDGLYTSGSFTYEGLYTWKDGYQNKPESLIRLNTTGTLAPSNKESCVVNLVATDDKISLFYRDDPDTSSSVNNLFLTGVNIFDRDVWYVSFGKKNSHDLSTYGTGSYFLRAAKQLNGEILTQFYTASFFEDSEASVFKNKSEYNTSGSFLVIGSQSLQEPSESRFLNDNTLTEENVNITDFHGMVSNIRFFSKNTSREEYINRAKNYDSFGVNDPRVNYNFTNLTTGSFERLILFTDAKQGTTGSSASGEINIFDFSQNNLHLAGSNFKASTNVMFNKRVNFERLSDKFDINFTKEKVRIRSFNDPENIEQGYFATTTPSFEVLPSEESIDDNRLSLDMSVMKGLNDNILRMFNDFTSLEDSLGKPNIIFGGHYSDLRYMREIYFNNIIEVLDLERYRDLFKWVDDSFTEIVYSMIPKTTNFLGINFIYESHVLERNRYQYLYDEIYMKALQRDRQRSQILLSQYVGKAKRH